MTEPLACFRKTGCFHRTRIVIPDVFRHRVAAMAGIAGHARILDVGFPIAVDILCHLQHPARDDLRVIRVERHVFAVMAVGAALLGRDPRRDAGHQPRELSHTQVFQNAGHCRIPRLPCRQWGRRAEEYKEF